MQAFWGNNCFEILYCRYFETFDMVSEESCTTKLDWKEKFAECVTKEDKGITALSSTH